VGKDKKDLVDWVLWWAGFLSNGLHPLSIFPIKPRKHKHHHPQQHKTINNNAQNFLQDVHAFYKALPPFT
jgi:hypothetical protein